MALRNQPYIPLYVQDFMSDEKLRECSAQSIGVYIFIMCFMHKSDVYGKILLRQKDRQSESDSKNFAYKLSKHLPFTTDVVEKSINELLEEKVIFIDGDFLVQKRMVKDNAISNARSKAGKKGAKTTNNKQNFVATKVATNYENENEVENESVIISKKDKIPTIHEFMNYAKEKLGDENYRTYELSIKFKYDSWIENDWKTSGINQRPIKNWKTTLLNTLPHLKKLDKKKSNKGAMHSLMEKHNING